MREAPLTRLVLDVSLGPTLGGDLRDVYLLVLNLNLRRKTYTQKQFSERGCTVRFKPKLSLWSPKSSSEATFSKDFPVSPLAPSPLHTVSCSDIGSTLIVSCAQSFTEYLLPSKWQPQLRLCLSNSATIMPQQECGEVHFSQSQVWQMLEKATTCPQQLWQAHLAPYPR